MKDLAPVFHVKAPDRIVMVLRRHPIVFLGDVVIVLALMAVPAAGWFLMQHFWPQMLESATARPALILLSSGYLMLVWHFLIAKFVDYYLDLWVVTNHKILNVEQHSLFSRTVSELELGTVQDVTSEVKGIIPTILNYGFVYVQTAGETERFIFEQVGHPDRVREHILELVEEHRKNPHTL